MKLRIPKLMLVQIFIEELINLYTDVSDARDQDSDGGSKITRGEVFKIVIDFIISVGMKIEMAILGVNRLSHGMGLKWTMIRIFSEEISRIPDHLDELRASDSDGGRRITRAEAIEIVGTILADATPKLIKVTDEIH